jgi:Putative MetA-pathway of phenol degradation
MKNNIKNYFLYLFLFTSFCFAQSPWTKEKGKAYVQLGATSLSYSKQQLNGKLTDLNADISDITTQIYSEYGITNKLEAQLVVPFKIINVETKIGNISNSLSGLGNVTLGLKYKLYDSNWKISGGILYSANSITKNNLKGLSSGFNANTLLPYLTVGSSSGKWYYFGNLGYGYMDNQYSDFMKLGAEIGYNIIDKGHIMLVLDNRIIVAKENAYLTDLNQWSSYSDRQSYSAVGIKLNYEFKKDKFGVNFAALGAFALDNAPSAPTLNFGIYTKL